MQTNELSLEELAVRIAERLYNMSRPANMSASAALAQLPQEVRIKVVAAAQVSIAYVAEIVGVPNVA